MTTPHGKPQLIALVRSAGPVPEAPGIAPKIAGAAQPSAIADVLNAFNARTVALFPASGQTAPSQGRAALPSVASTGLPASVFHRVIAEDQKLDALAKALRGLPVVEAAYVKPAPEPAINRMKPHPAAPSLREQTPDFTGRQGYLESAPGGIDARYAWTMPGGKGAGVSIIDVEGEWRTSQEDLGSNGGLLAGTAPNDQDWRNHGTAVIGTCIAAANSFGVTGICPDAKLKMISIFGDENRTSSAAIREAAERLSAGDILLIELHYPGPRNGFAPRNDQNGYIAVEWWPDEFDAVQYAVRKGVIVVEAGGNGAQDLDDPLYEQRDPGFPVTWTNPFRRSNRDSGAILVGAGAPPPGTHNRNFYGPDRSRLDFSNYGSSVDVQGWGREVTTCGYGDLQGGTDEDRWYTDQFSGTSSASPIIVGTLACLQGIRRAQGAPLLTPAQARNILRQTGSPQQDGPNGPASQRIGNRPDLKALIAALQGPVA